MGENLGNLKRTAMCGDVTETLAGKKVTVMGWVNKRRDLGKLIFIALRDRTGIVQAVVDGNTACAELFQKAESVRGEYVLALTGEVALRTAENINDQMKTGKIEIAVSEMKILSEAETVPFSVSDVGVKEDLRLKYRYLDLRRPQLQNNFMIRHKAMNATRECLNAGGFLEIETPILTKSTPEGARDYLVPSRVYPGTFYALPQSPQIFKQLLMVSGFDKYYQIARCFRDEDLRTDRQPEFTQIDIEMSFVEQDDIISMCEKLIKTIMLNARDIDVNIPFPRMSYKEAMERFGSDKPDTRFGVELCDISNIVSGSEFGVFQNALDSGGSVRGINAPGCGSYPRKQIDSLIDVAKDFRAKGLAWISISDSGELKTTLSKFFTDEKLNEIVNAFNGKPGDLILICADKNDVVFDALGNVRLEINKREKLSNPDDFNFLWVTEFPLFEYSEEDDRLYAKHHPFTSPLDEDIPLFETDPQKMRAKAYDLVLNGTELGGGSIRIYQKDIQEKMFKALNFTMEQAYAQFSHLLDAFKYGAPPHGGIALGLDRIIMSLTGGSIRDVIAFPKVKDASCPLTSAPDTVTDEQLKELGLIIDNTAMKALDVH